MKSIVFIDRYTETAHVTAGIIVSRGSPFQGKLILVHDESRLNPKAAWIHYRWVQTGTRSCIQAERERPFKEETLKGFSLINWNLAIQPFF